MDDTTHRDEGFTQGRPLGDVVDLFEQKADAIASDWHDKLTSQLRFRPSNVFPGDALLDGMPRVVAWIARSVRNGSQPDRENEEALRDVAAHWRDAGFSIEESLLHFRILASILFERLGLSVAEAETELSPDEAVRTSARLCHTVHLAQVVLVATYRDAEEDRIADFGANLAHEIRNHLGSASVAVELVRTLRNREDVVPDSAREGMLLERADAALKTTRQLVESVWAVSERGAAANDEWHMRSLREIVHELLPDIEAESEDVRVRVDDDVPGVPVPESPVSLILHNLLQNGIKYADPQKPERWVRVQCRRGEDGHLVVQVGDNGLGVSEAEQERIFTRFRRGSQARGDGFGLGLSIARQAARRIGSRLMLESEPGRGSTFGFTIPLEAQKEAPGG